MSKAKLEIVATVVSLIIMVALCSIIVGVLSLNDRAQLGVYIFLIPISITFVYFWHEEKFFGWKDYLYGILFGAVWTVVGIIWIVNTYNIDIESFLHLEKEAWNKIGYIGFVVVGPVIIVLSILSFTRETMIHKFMK